MIETKICIQNSQIVLRIQNSKVGFALKADCFKIYEFPVLVHRKRLIEKFSEIYNFVRIFVNLFKILFLSIVRHNLRLCLFIFPKVRLVIVLF